MEAPLASRAFAIIAPIPRLSIFGLEMKDGINLPDPPPVMTTTWPLTEKRFAASFDAIFAALSLGMRLI